MANSLEYCEPVNLEDAVSKKTKLVDRVQEIQAALANKNMLTPNGRRVSSVEYWTQRQRLQEELKQVLAVLRRIKDWIRGRSTTVKKPVDDRQEIEEWDGTLLLAKDAFTDLWSYISFLENKVRGLTEENKKLREISF